MPKDLPFELKPFLKLVELAGCVIPEEREDTLTIPPSFTRASQY